MSDPYHPGLRLPPLRGLDDWRRSTHRPVLLVGNGPSANSVDPRRLPHDPVVVRCNAFLFEADYVFGDRVDGFFWAVARRWLQVAVAVASERRDYSFGTFFSPVTVAREGLYSLRGEAAWLAETLEPRTCHFDILRAHPEIGQWFAQRDQRRRPGLPTQGMQALATLLCLGFRDIHVTGIDFYQSTRQRYAFAYPTVVQEMTAPVHLAPGYEGKYHSIRLDIEFFLALRQHFPDASIQCLSEDSFFANVAATSPLRSGPVSTNGRRLGTMRSKDHIGFTTALRTALHAPYSGPNGVVGEVAQVGPDKLLVWAWRPEEPTQRRPVEIRANGRKVRTTLASRYLFELELGCVGDAAHGFVVSRSALTAEHGRGPIEFFDALTGRRLANGTVAPFGILRTDRKSWAETILVGGAILSAEERAAMAQRAAIDKVFVVPAELDGLGSEMRNILIETWPEAEALHGVIPPQLEAELAGLCWAMATWPDCALWLAGFRFLAGATQDLLEVGRLAPNLARALLAGFHDGTFGLLVSQPATALLALDIMMQPLVIVTDQVGTLAAGQAAQVSLAHAMLQIFPHAHRIDAGLWDIGLEEVLPGLPSGVPVLIDGAAVVSMPGPVLTQLLARLRQREARIIVPFSNLTEGNWLGSTAAEFVTRLQSLHAHGAQFIAPSADVRRLLSLVGALPGSAILPGDPPRRWNSVELRPKPTMHCLLVTDSLTPDLLRVLRQARMKLPFGQRSRVHLDVVTDRLFGVVVPGSNDGESLIWGCGIRDPDTIGRYDLVILATQDVGVSLAARFIAASHVPVPVLAVRGCGMAELLHQEAVLPDLDAALAVIAALAEGQSRIGSQAPGNAARTGRAALAGLVGVLFPDQVQGEAVALLTNTAMTTQPRTLDLRLGAALQLAVVSTEATPEQGARFSLFLGNGGMAWLPRGGASGDGMQVVLQMKPLAGSAPLVTLTRRLPHDVAPADAIVLHFVPPDDMPQGEIHVSASVHMGADRCIALRDFGTIGHGSKL